MATGDYAYVKSIDELKLLIDKLSSHNGPIGYDIETGYDGPDKKKGALFPYTRAFTVGFSITDDPSYARYVPLRHDNGPNLDPDVVWKMMKPLLESKRIIPHHAKFETKFARNVGINLGVLADTMLDAFVLATYRAVGLKDLVFDLFGHEMAKIETLFPGATDAQLKALRFNVLDLTPDVVEYACEDAAWTLATFFKIDAEAQTKRKFMYQLEHRISEQMVDVEMWGVGVDWDALTKERVRAEQFMEHYATYVKELLGEMSGQNLAALNLNSADQLRKLLYDTPEEGGLGLSTSRMTKGSEKTPPQPSTDKVALETLAQKHPGVKALLLQREITNLRNRFVKWLEEKKGEVPIRGADNRVHANYSQVTVAAGRFAANDPAIQQLPKDWFWAIGKLGAEYEAEKDPVKKAAIKAEILAGDPELYWRGNYRDYIIPAPGWYYLSFDFSQIELRFMAGLSQEPALLKAFEEKRDVHSLTAAMMYGVPLESVSPEQRDGGKTFNFALIYQMGIKSLAERLGITYGEAQDLYDTYFAQFSSIRTWMERQKTEGKRLGYCETYFGRKVTVWELKSPLGGVVAKGERLLINAPVQGSAADYMKLAQLRAEKVLREAGMWGESVKIVANLHDALTFEVREDVDPLMLRQLLEPQVTFEIPKFPKIVADWELGYSWGSSEKWKTGMTPVWDGSKWGLILGGIVGKTEDVPPEIDRTQYVRDPEEDMPEAEIDQMYAKGTPVAVSGPGKTILVRLSDWPTKDALLKFKRILADTPGPNEIVVVTPDGEEVPMDGTSGITPDDQPRISLTLGGAMVHLAADSVDTQNLVADLIL